MGRTEKLLADLVKAIEKKWCDRKSTPPKELIPILELARTHLNREGKSEA